jgi:pimeloyl-ACP methyl ester carboxylesterase
VGVYAVLAGAVSVLAIGALFASGIAALVFVAVTYGSWLQHERRTNASRSEEDGQDLKLTLLVEFWSAFLMILMRPFGSMDPTWAPVSRDAPRRRPILLVAGYGNTRAAFALLAPRLRAQNLGPVYSINLRPSTASMEELSRRLMLKIEELASLNGATEIDLVAHSTGGIVARMTLLHARKRCIRRMVTVATPHSGTHLAAIIPGVAGRELAENSELLRRLPDPPKDMVVAISSTHDNVVVPSANGRIGDLGRDMVFRDVGHLSMVFDGSVADAVIQALGEDVRAEPVLMMPLAEGKVAVEASLG